MQCSASYLAFVAEAFAAVLAPLSASYLAFVAEAFAAVLASLSMEFANSIFTYQARGPVDKAKMMGSLVERVSLSQTVLYPRFYCSTVCRENVSICLLQHDAL